MRRSIAVTPKIRHRPHEPFAKVMLPNTIDRHPRSQRLFAGEKPPSKIEPTWRCPICRRKGRHYFGHTRKHPLALFFEIASNQHVRFAGLRLTHPSPALRSTHLPPWPSAWPSAGTPRPPVSKDPAHSDSKSSDRTTARWPSGRQNETRSPWMNSQTPHPPPDPRTLWATVFGIGPSIRTASSSMPSTKKRTDWPASNTMAT